MRSKQFGVAFASALVVALVVGPAAQAIQDDFSYDGCSAHAYSSSGVTTPIATTARTGGECNLQSVIFYKVGGITKSKAGPWGGSWSEVYSPVNSYSGSNHWLDNPRTPPAAKSFWL